MSCDGGKRNRERICINENAELGVTCPGAGSEEDYCNAQVVILIKDSFENLEKNFFKHIKFIFNKGLSYVVNLELLGRLHSFLRWWFTDS